MATKVGKKTKKIKMKLTPLPSCSNPKAGQLGGHMGCWNKKIDRKIRNKKSKTSRKLCNDKNHRADDWNQQYNLILQTN